MKTKLQSLFIGLVLLSVSGPQLSTVFAQGGGAFTYQGRLGISGAPFNG